ncbi:extracellular solute-binding protein [Candidatus Nomurabacteria bacterium]|nr:extracellular solute-binding protein [Candidatus Nomurabacteria bacterium]
MKGNFQIIIVVVFIITAVLGVLVFSGAIPLDFTSDPESVGQGVVVLWGTESSQVILPLLEEFNTINATFDVQYVQKFPETFNQELLEALASGQGPDMFFMPDDLALSYENKIFTIPYTSYPIASFENSFISAGRVFATSKGIMAFPITVDPLVMYYNRSMLEANGIVYPPKYWDEFENLIPLLTKKDTSNKITKSTIAFGQYANVNHAKDILATLFMQAGNPIVTEQNGAFVSVLNQPTTDGYNPELALQFYTDFTDPLKNVYSWNRSFINSRDAFSAENLAFYFGYASELEELVNKNPNQNFFVAPLPQVRNSSFRLTGAKVTGVAISSTSKNFNTAFIAANLMASSDFAYQLANALNITPARRDLLSIAPQDAYSPTFYSSALYARSWLDPSPLKTDNIFQEMIEGVLANTFSVSGAIKDAGAKMGLLLIK